MACGGTVRLRRAGVADAAGIARVHMRGWQKSHQGLVPDAYLACVVARFREEAWREELELKAADRRPWVALIDDRVVGFADVGISRDDDAAAAVGEVYLLYVDPDCWGRGIGQNLLAHASRDLERHGFEVATFWVVSDNVHSRRFAEQHGWSSDGSVRSEDCGGTEVQQLRYERALHPAEAAARQ